MHSISIRALTDELVKIAEEKKPWLHSGTLGADLVKGTVIGAGAGSAYDLGKEVRNIIRHGWKYSDGPGGRGRIVGAGVGLLAGLAGHHLRKPRDKTAGVSLDAGARALQADRQGRLGKDYHPGGQLPSNAPEEPEVDFVPKIAAKEVRLPTAKDVRLPTKDDWHKTYRKGRAPAGAAVRGALVGSLVANILSGGKAKGWTGYRLPAALGGGLGVADYIAQGKKTKTAMMGSGTFTPGRALTQSRNVGSFQDKLIHKGDRLRPATVGQKHIIPQ